MSCRDVRAYEMVQLDMVQANRYCLKSIYLFVILTEMVRFEGNGVEWEEHGPGRDQ